ncbi:hypothetical protein [Rosistilla ulvae]|nr:hypothetical protein [Rosistilla ulvae]
MWIVPILAIAAALIALRPSRIPYAGKTFACVGLGLGLFFGSWAVASHGAAEQVHLNSAKRFATDWLNCFKSGEAEFCFEMTLPEKQRRYKAVNLESFYANPAAPDDGQDAPPGEPVFSDFIEQPLVKSLLNADKKPEWEFDGAINTFKTVGLRRWTLRFRDTSGTITDPISVTLEARETHDAKNKWVIKDVVTAE